MKIVNPYFTECYGPDPFGAKANLWLFVAGAAAELFAACRSASPPAFKRWEKEKSYRLFLAIQEDVRADLSSLCYYDIEQDRFGFPPLKRTLRCLIEAYVDLYALHLDPGYGQVMECNARKRPRSELDAKYLRHAFHKDFGRDRVFFNIGAKIKMALGLYGADKETEAFFSDLARRAGEYNKYAHPDVFLVPPKDKAAELADLLRLHFTLLARSFELLLKSSAFLVTDACEQFRLTRGPAYRKKKEETERMLETALFLE